MSSESHLILTFFPSRSLAITSIITIAIQKPQEAVDETPLVSGMLVQEIGGDFCSLDPDQDRLRTRCGATASGRGTCGVSPSFRV